MELPFYHEYLESAQFNSDGTRKKYLSTLTRFTKWYNFKKDLANSKDYKFFFDLSLASSFVMTLKKQKLSYSYINVCISAIKHYVEFVRTHKNITFFNVADLKLIRYTHISKNKHLPEEFVLKFYAALEGYESDIQFALTALISTGIRVNELKLVDWNQLQYSKTTVLRGAKENKDRDIYSNPKLLSKLPYNSNWSFSQAKISAVLKDMKMKIEYKGQLTPHTLRYTYGNRIYRKGGRLEHIMHLMGHANMDVTLKYVGSDEEKKEITNGLQFLEQDEAIEYSAVLEENVILRKRTEEQARLIKKLKGIKGVNYETSSN